MNLTRWKMLAAGFGISVCGLAALAEPACRSVGHTAGRSEPAAPESKPKGATEPKSTPVAVSPLILVELPVPPTIPAIPEPTPAKPLSLKEATAIAIEQGKSEVKPEVGVTTPAEIPLPAPALLQESKSKPIPTPLLPIPAPVPSAPVFIGPIVTVEQLDPNFAKPLTPPIPAPVAFPNVGVAQQPVEYFPVPTPLTPISSVAPSEKKLRVNLQMDEGNPKFEVRDGEEVVLKVVSDKVDVTSPKNKGERWSTLKAMGQVKFMTPGGDGYCDELQVVPGTGEVIAVGHVKFTYNWGKVETSASAEKMSFRLGTK